MKKICSAILLLLFCTSLLFGQQLSSEGESEKKNRVGISIGTDRGLVKDVNYSPLNYTEKGTLYKIDYQRLAPDLKFSAQAVYSTGIIQTEASPVFDSDYIQGFLALDFWKPLKNSSSTYSLNWGVGYHFYIYYLEWGNLDAYSFLANHSANVNVSFYQKIATRHALYAKLSVPVLNFLIRPPYAATDEELARNQDKPLKLITDGRLTSFNKVLEYAFELDYAFELSPRFLLHVNYTHRYQNVTEIKQIIHFQHQLSVGASFNF